MWQIKTITEKIFKKKTVFYDNVIFRLHYRITFWLLVIGSVLVTMRQYIGEHIHCIAQKSLEHVINTYCFFSTTFTVVRNDNRTDIWAHPGVGPYVPDRDEIVYHAYYQWVPFVLFGQGLSFYLGHILWKAKEGGRMEAWAGNPVPKDQVLLRIHIWRDWAKWHVACELFNFLNLVLQVYLTDLFLLGNFYDLGLSSADSLDYVFPKVTKCTFRKYGPSGTMETNDALCVVALNIVNEKIYWVLWMWYIALGAASLLGLAWRGLTFTCHSSSWLTSLVWADLGAPRPPVGTMDPSHAAYIIATKSTFSDWLLLYYLSKNLKPLDFTNILEAMEAIDSSPTPLTRKSTPAPAYSILPQADKDKNPSDKLHLDMPDKSESDC